MALTKIAYADEINFGKKKPSTNQVIDALSPVRTMQTTQADIKHIGKSRSIDMSSLEGSPNSTKKS